MEGTGRDWQGRLLAAIDAFLERVRVEAPFAERNLTEARDRLRGLVESGGPDEARDEVVRALLGMYGGMGSVNDFPWSRAGERAREELYAALVAARGHLAGAVFGPRHDPASFARVPVGARVRLIEGRPVHVDARSGRRTTVSARDGASGLVWEVRAVLEPDATGMPCYLLAKGNRFQSARVEAFEVLPVGPGDPSAGGRARMRDARTGRRRDRNGP